MFFRQIFDVRAARELDVLNIDSQKYNKVLKIISAICVAVMPFIFTSAGVVGTTMLVVGGPRYHLPMLPILIMAAALTVQCIYVKIHCRRVKK